MGPYPPSRPFTYLVLRGAFSDAYPDWVFGVEVAWTWDWHAHIWRNLVLGSTLGGEIEGLGRVWASD